MDEFCTDAFDAFAKAFDDLSFWEKIEYKSNVVAYFDFSEYPKTSIHPEDKAANRTPFLLYIGSQSRQELKQVAKDYRPFFFKSSTRKAKRLNYPFELKIRGLKFQMIKEICKEI